MEAEEPGDSPQQRSFQPTHGHGTHLAPAKARIRKVQYPGQQLSLFCTTPLAMGLNRDLLSQTPSCHH